MYNFRQELWTEIEQRFVLEGERPLRIIGHSLGGALASLAALDFYLNFKPVGTSLESMTVRTYGCPCVGNKSFVDLYNESIKGQGSKDEHRSDGSKFTRAASQVNLCKRLKTICDIHGSCTAFIIGNIRLWLRPRK